MYELFGCSQERSRLAPKVPVLLRSWCDLSQSHRIPGVAMFRLEFLVVQPLGRELTKRALWEMLGVRLRKAQNRQSSWWYAHRGHKRDSGLPKGNQKNTGGLLEHVCLQIRASVYSKQSPKEAWGQRFARFLSEFFPHNRQGKCSLWPTGQHWSPCENHRVRLGMRRSGCLHRGNSPREFHQNYTFHA